MKPVKLIIRKSNRHMGAQLVSLHTGNTILTLTTMDKQIFPGLRNANLNDAVILAHKFCSIAQSMGIYSIQSYSKKYPYHGKLKVFIETTRKNGMKYFK